MSGGFVRDATRWGDEGRIEIEAPAQVAPNIGNVLPPAVRASLEALRELLASGRVPQLRQFSPEFRWGLDLRSGSHRWRIGGEDWNPTSLRLLDDPPDTDRSREVFPIATDSDGALYVLLVDGRVGAIDKESAMLGVIGDCFPSLDDYLWAITRASACPEHLSPAEAISMLASVEGADELIAEIAELAELAEAAKLWRANSPEPT